MPAARRAFSAASFARRYPDLGVTVLRFALLFGPGVHTFYTRIFDHRVVPMLMGFDPLVQLLHPDDAVEAALRAIERRPRGAFNVVPSHPIPLATMLHLGAKIPVAVPHPVAYVAADALWAMEEGLRCGALGAVIGEIWGDPAALDFTATRRLAVAAERHGVPALLVRMNAVPNLSGARTRWRVTSAVSEAHPFNPRAPGEAAWEGELIRARGHPPGRWRISHERPGATTHGAAHRGDLVAAPADRALGEDRRRA